MAKSFKHLEAEIKREGSAIILPEVPAPAGMTYDQAIETLQKKRDSEDAVVAIAEFVEGYAPFDAAWAFMEAMRRKFGWVDSVPTPNLFGPNPPTYTTIRTGPKSTDFVQIISGRFVIPGVEGNLNTAIADHNNRHTFVVHGQTKRKCQPIIAELMTLTREIVANESIYRGQAVKLPIDRQGNTDWNDQLGFMNLSGVDPDSMVFSEELREQIDVNLFAPVVHTGVCRSLKIPLKRGVLLEGTYGTGKTLVASVLAKIATANGWTFVLIPDARGLAEAVEFAKNYSPAVVFCEDIDRQMSRTERSVEMDDILNTIDGIGSKSTEIMVVLTTNHVETINPAMLRPGRLDAVISITPPDAAAARKLVRLYGRSSIAANDTLERSGEVLAGMIPAVIREVVERSKLAAVCRTGSDKVWVTDHDLVVAAKGMQRHLALLNKKRDEQSDAEVFAEKLHKLTSNGTTEALADLRGLVLEVRENQ